MESKLIAGKKHYRRPCIFCKELIWTDKKSGTVSCTTCNPEGVRSDHVLGHPCPQSDRQYYGRCQE